MTPQRTNQPSSAAMRAWSPPMPLSSERLLQLRMEEGKCMGLDNMEQIVTPLRKGHVRKASAAGHWHG